MKKAISIFASFLICINSFPLIACAQDIVPPEEYEQLTHTRYEPWLANYLFVTPNQIKYGVKGGEEKQIQYAKAISEIDENYMLYGTDTSGIYYSHDGGKDWKVAKTGWTGSCNHLAFYPGSKDICFAQNGSGHKTVGMYKSEDAGVNWRKTFSGTKSGKNLDGRIAFSKKNKNGNYPIYTITTQMEGKRELPQEGLGIFRSDDIGETYKSLGFEDYPVYDVYADTSSDRVIICGAINTAPLKTGTNGGIHVSYDAGESWTTLSLAREFPNNSHVNAITVNPLNPDNWICAVRIDKGVGVGSDGNEANLYGVELYRTFDSGKTWEFSCELEGLQDYCPMMVNQLIYTYPDEKGEVKLIVSLSQTLNHSKVSTDNGLTFKDLQPDFVVAPELYEKIKNDEITMEEYKKQLSDYAKKEDLYISNTITLFSSNILGSWYESSVALTPSNPDLIFGLGCGGTSISHDGGRTFNFTAHGIGGAMVINVVYDENGQYRFIGAYDTGIEYKMDGYEGEFPPMMSTESKYPPWKGGSKTCGSIAVDPNNPEHCFGLTGAEPYGLPSTIVETYDGFRSDYRLYRAMGNRLDEISEERGSVANLGFIKYHPQNSSVLYTDKFISEDGGKTWRELEYDVEAVDNIDGDVLYRYEGNNSAIEIYISFDRGTNWSATGVKLSNVRFRPTADLFEPYVLWVPRHGGGGIYRVDLKTNSVVSMGNANGIHGWGFTDYQMDFIRQNPRDKNHLIAIGREFYAEKGVAFETYDGGKNWHMIEGFPYGCGMASVVFNPVKDTVVFGSGMGMWVYDYSIYKEHYPQLLPK